jgi:hypothetical protein
MVKILLSDKRCNFNNDFCAYITAAQLTSADTLNVDIQSNCIEYVETNTDMINFLLDNVTVNTNTFSTALKYAVVYNNIDMVKKILTNPNRSINMKMNIKTW